MRSPGPDGGARQQGGNYNAGDMKGKKEFVLNAYPVFRPFIPFLDDLFCISINPPRFLNGLVLLDLERKNLHSVVSGLRWETIAALL
jgi:hypothetical protein